MLHAIIPSTPRSDDAVPDLAGILGAQRAAQLKDGPPSAALRKDRLTRMISVLVDHADVITEALHADFGTRAKDMTRLTDVVAPLKALKHARDHVEAWMRPERRMATFPFNVMGGRAQVVYQPKGVVGVISPWNFPVQLGIGPLAGILAAGNRVMLKPSELTPSITEVIERMIKIAFDPLEVTVVTGGPAVGKAFSELAFDHILFTGSTRVGQMVMRAAAEHLTPVTLELGGKSPVIVGASADIPKAAANIMNGKLMNAGQICLAPDHVFVPAGKVGDFAAAATAAAQTMYPTLKDNPDYTSLVSGQHFDRIRNMVEDARAKGADVIEINPAGEDMSDPARRKVAPTLIINPTPDMLCLKQEIFGPVLPIMTYTSIDETIRWVNDRPRPLALYYFGSNADEERRLLSETTSGGVTINDVIMHVLQEELPFGGVGASGIGSYHGRDGFKAFSHAKAVYRQSPLNPTKLTMPPYTNLFRKMIAFDLKK